MQQPYNRDTVPIEFPAQELKGNAGPNSHREAIRSAIVMTILAILIRVALSIWMRVKK